LKQITEYLDFVGGAEAHLIIFDRDKNSTWDEKIFQRLERVDHKRINVWGV